MGISPAKQYVVLPWKCFIVDIIESYTLKSRNDMSFEFMCVTIVDPTMGTLEIEKIPTVVSVENFYSILDILIWKRPSKQLYFGIQCVEMYKNV